MAMEMAWIVELRRVVEVSVMDGAKGWRQGGKAGVGQEKWEMTGDRGERGLTEFVGIGRRSFVTARRHGEVSQLTSTSMATGWLIDEEPLTAALLESASAT